MKRTSHLFVEVRNTSIGAPSAGNSQRFVLESTGYGPVSFLKPRSIRPFAFSFRTKSMALSTAAARASTALAGSLLAILDIVPNTKSVGHSPSRPILSMTD